MGDEAVNTKMISCIPIGCISEPKDMAPMVAFLYMLVASYITRQIICADGERIMKG